MRRPQNHLSPAEALAILRAAKVHHLATTTPDGLPVLRALNGVVLGEAVYFHGAPKGEKMQAMGRPAVVSAHEVLAEIPSHWIGPERACPASTWYQSAQVKGTLLRVTNPVECAQALQGIMVQNQPEGGHREITADDPLYAKIVRQVGVFKLPFESITGKLQLGQGKASRLPAIVEGLWRRGRPGDLRTLELMSQMYPDLTLPAQFGVLQGASGSPSPTAGRVQSGG